MAGSDRSVLFYLGLGSRYSYLAATQIAALAEKRTQPSTGVQSLARRSPRPMSKPHLSGMLPRRIGGVRVFQANTGRAIAKPTWRDGRTITVFLTGNWNHRLWTHSGGRCFASQPPCWAQDNDTRRSCSMRSTGMVSQQMGWPAGLMLLRRTWTQTGFAHWLTKALPKILTMRGSMRPRRGASSVYQPSFTAMICIGVMIA